MCICACVLNYENADVVNSFRKQNNYVNIPVANKESNLKCIFFSNFPITTNYICNLSFYRPTSELCTKYVGSDIKIPTV